jgi:uncharacterized protein involved in outer membrane biogenesis
VDGIFSVAGIKTSKTREEKPLAPTPRKKLSLLIGSLKLRDGEINFHDRSGPTPLDLVIKNVDADIKNFSMTEPLLLDIQMSILSQKQNIAVSGKLQLPQENRSGFLENFVLKSDLSKLDGAEAVKVFPALGAMDLKQGLTGDLQVNIDQLNLGSQAGLDSGKAQIRLKDGKIFFKQLQAPLENLYMDARLQNQKLVINDISAEFARGSVRISGTLDQPLSQAVSDIRASFKDLSLEVLLPSSRGAPGLGGRVSVDFQGRATGTQWPQFSQTLSGEGRLVLREGVLLNYNILRVVIEKSAKIPLLGETLLANFPIEYRTKLDEPNTLFQPADLSFTVNGGKINFPNVLLTTEHFGMHGAAQLGWDKSILANAVFLINPVMSNALVKSTPQVKFLINQQSQLEIPLQIQGVMPRLTFLPDTQYLTSRIALAGVQHVMSNVIQKPAEGVAEGVDGAENSLAGLLNKAFKND